MHWYIYVYRNVRENGLYWLCERFYFQFVSTFCGETVSGLNAPWFSLLRRRIPYWIVRNIASLFFIRFGGGRTKVAVAVLDVDGFSRCGTSFPSAPIWILFPNPHKISTNNLFPITCVLKLPVNFATRTAAEYEKVVKTICSSFLALVFDKRMGRKAIKTRSAQPERGHTDILLWDGNQSGRYLCFVNEEPPLFPFTFPLSPEPYCRKVRTFGRRWVGGSLKYNKLLTCHLIMVRHFSHLFHAWWAINASASTWRRLFLILMTSNWGGRVLCGMLAWRRPEPKKTYGQNGFWLKNRRVAQWPPFAVSDAIKIVNAHFRQIG